MQDTDQQVILDGERALIEAQRSADRATAARLLAADFCEIGQSGRLLTREEVLDGMTAAPVIAFALEPRRWIEVADDCIILLYASDVSRHMDGVTRRRHALRSSTWRREDGEWRMLFHHGTPLPTTMGETP